MPEPVWNNELQSEEEQFDYRSKWACFDCRTSFVRVRENDSEVKCPSCAKTATDMGYLFESPSKRNKRLWAIMYVLGRNGIRYSTAGNVAYINHMITGQNKLTLREVEENVARFLEKNN